MEALLRLLRRCLERQPLTREGPRSASSVSLSLDETRLVTRLKQ